eukprot:COSAG04_NODE_167_length_21718_cov_556.193293_4_plen_352_part_00
MTTTLFHIMICDTYGEASYHSEDYTIDCNTPEYTATMVLGILLIIVIPFGLPAAIFYKMFGAKQALGGVRSNATGGAKLAADDMDDDDDTFAFLIGVYRPECWYHEIVTYVRKLLLSGIAVVMGRGSMAQAYFACACEAFFLMHHMRTYPFVNYKHNLMEAFGHCALILLYAVSLILRNNDEDDWRAEWLPKEGYGWFLVFLFVVVLPSPTVIYFQRGGKSRSNDASFVASGNVFESENPLAADSKPDSQVAVDAQSDLEGLTLGQVKARAKELGVGDELDAAIQLVLKAEAELPPTEEQLREELADMTMRQLKARAKEAGASGDDIDNLDDTSDFRAAAVDLIVSLTLAV